MGNLRGSNIKEKEGRRSVVQKTARRCSSSKPPTQQCSLEWSCWFPLHLHAEAVVCPQEVLLKNSISESWAELLLPEQQHQRVQGWLTASQYLSWHWVRPRPGLSTFFVVMK